ncbi:type II secretion system F family protein [Yersinia kristensenii]|uniref:type II secretion system F family protein n=1 Tax=Yersinia kristensenii TaxID=28152 RepID=UPI000C157DFB|nr:type II secretion system F family protein [Yersinia kristensenii]MDA5523600.1 type II secretion system F family protein [Yersinia kristensenii]PHZ35759.1 tight adherance operon protein [Yersinia kristensenii]
MIYYIIILSSGLLLLILNNIKWLKIKRSVIKEKKTKKIKSDNRYFFIAFYKRILKEWLTYLSTILKERNTLHILIPVIYSICIYAVNYFWFNFNFLIILFFIMISVIYFQLRLSRKRHHTLFKKDFPEALLMINMAASSGASINQVLERCGQEISGPLGNEFSLICRRLNVGESPEAVFYDSYQRFKHPEFYFLITITLLNLQQGGQLRELTSRLSEVINNNKTTEQKKAVMTAQVRMSVNIISIMPIAFSFLLYFLDPTTIESMWDHPIGRMIYYYIITSEIVGIILIRKMLGKST